MRIIASLVVLLIVIFISISLRRTTRIIAPPQPVSSPSPKVSTQHPQIYKDIQYKESVYRVAWFAPTDPSAIKLIPNFEDKRSSVEIRKKHGCSYLTNGGFYTQTHEPLGLFAINNHIQVKFKTSLLLNAIFSVSASGKVSMTQTAPEGDHRIQLQSGPLLISAGRPERLRMKQDEATRRVFVAIDEEQRVIFGVVYHTEEVFKGPILSDLPEIINLFSQKTGIKLVSAMNLDGGSASVFADENIFLGELSNVGSFFCVVQK